jgi:thiamine-monophosphate kinase
MPVTHINEFFDGLAEACAEFGLSVAGGNIRSAQRFAAHGTALGLVRTKPFLGRGGAKPGDYLLVIGECGKFISTYLKARREGIRTIDEADLQVVTRPRPQLLLMRSLRDAGLIEAASDNSDGLLGAIWNVCESSLCAADIEMNNESLPQVVLSNAQIEGINPWNIMFFWGDYNVVVAVRSHRIKDFIDAARALNVSYRLLGRMSAGPPALHGLIGSERRQLRLLRNENFRQQGFNSDVNDHVNYMLREQLFIK